MPALRFRFRQENTLNPSRSLVLVIAFVALACGSQTAAPSGGEPTDAGGVSNSGSGGAPTVALGGSMTAGASGGSAIGGGAGVTAGGTSANVPVDTEPPFSPTNVSAADAQGAYDTWKAAHLEDCSGGVWRVRWESAKQDATVSESIGYGMLLTEIYGDRAAYDGLLAYAKLMRQPNQLMNWLRYGCDAHRDTKYSDYPDNSASDADLDVAMSLIMAECKWSDGPYGDEASTVISAIKQNMFVDDGGLHVLEPGDSAWFDMLGSGCVNYSYMAPAYYRAFAKQVAADAEFWNKAADDTYELLAKASDATTGLVRNWGSANGGQATDECNTTYKRAGSYGSDAARTPWRIATDYLWFGTAKAKSWNDKVTTWVKSQGVKNIIQWYNLDGTPDMQSSTWNNHSAVNVGPFSVGAMTFDQATVNEFAAELLAIPATAGSHDAEYFPRMLKALSLVTLTGQFTQCSAK